MFNGVIIQRFEDRLYRGVEGDNWYLNDSYQESLGLYFETNIDKSWLDSECIDVSNDWGFINKYVELSKKNNIQYRLILCETEKQRPKLKNIEGEMHFIGYDYAYAGGSYYSVVYNDICSGRVAEFKNFELNKYGLFEKLDDLTRFIDKREKLMQSNQRLNFEGGQFVVFKLYEIDKVF